MKPFGHPKVLVLHEKHEPRYFHIPNEKTLHLAALKVLTERVKYDYWYYDEEDSEAKEIVSYGTGSEAYTFLKARSRAGYEYERISLDEYEAL